MRQTMEEWKLMFEKVKEYTVALLLFLLVVFFGMTVPEFATLGNLFNLLRQAAILGIVSSGMVMVIITGNIDLSVGSMVSLVSCVTAILIGQKGISPVPACIMGILLCILLMTLNGALIIFTGMPAMLCTLALMNVYQGIAYIITNAVPVYGLPEKMRMLGQGYVGWIPIPVIIMGICFIISWMILSRTYIGRYFYAVGSNAEATRLSGISIVRSKLLAYVFCGVMVGIATLVQMSRLFGGYPIAGQGLEMEVIIAVVVGGVSFSGGKGGIGGVVQGVLLMGVLSNGLGVMGAGTYIQLVFKGVVLLLVVGLDYFRQKRRRREG